jgi:hypothetical protein
MQPLVLAIEPDLRQAAIVKRIVREKVLADVTVVDSRDAALEAMRSSVPDVLLLSALLSPRDEDELVAHLRTLEHAEHLQTHTIPQLASSIEHGADKPSKGLLSSLWRRKGSGAAPAGCDPDLFAEEIRAYLKRASDKKREVRDGVASPDIAATISASKAAHADAGPKHEEAAPASTSSWESPFEWRPSRGMEREERKAAPAAAAAAAPAETVEAAEPVEEFVFSPEPVEAPAAEPVFNHETVETPAADFVFSAEAVETPAPEFVFSPESIDTHAAEPVGASSLESVVSAIPEPAFAASPEPVVVSLVSRKLPLVVRQTREWWYEEGERRAAAREPACELRAVLSSLSMPYVAAATHADGCRIRRVRLSAA